MRCKKIERRENYAKSTIKSHNYYNNLYKSSASLLKQDGEQVAEDA